MIKVMFLVFALHYYLIFCVCTCIDLLILLYYLLFMKFYVFSCVHKLIKMPILWIIWTSCILVTLSDYLDVFILT